MGKMYRVAGSPPDHRPPDHRPEDVRFEEGYDNRRQANNLIPGFVGRQNGEKCVPLPLFVSQR
jgi:hypothetical protein